MKRRGINTRTPCQDLGSIPSNDLSLQRQLVLFMDGEEVKDHGYSAALLIPIEVFFSLFILIVYLSVLLVLFYHLMLNFSCLRDFKACLIVFKFLIVCLS